MVPAIGCDFESIPRQNHCALLSVKGHSSGARFHAAGSTLTNLANHLHARILDDGVLGIRHLAVIFQIESSATTCDRLRPFQVQGPVRNVERVLAKVCHLPARVIPKPPKMVYGAVRIVSASWRWPEPHIPIQFPGWFTVRRVTKTGSHVAREITLHRDNLTEAPAFYQF